MKRALVITYRPSARRDVDEIAIYIAADNRTAAVRFYQEFDNTVALLARTPGIGTPLKFRREDLKTARRLVMNHFRNYVVYYVRRNNVITILRVLHAARDRETLMDADL